MACALPMTAQSLPDSTDVFFRHLELKEITVTGAVGDMKIKESPMPIATLSGLRFKQHEFRLYPGDSLFVYTDGVAEATNADNELFGCDRMLDALNRDADAEPRQILENVMQDINRFVDEAEQFDDITMLCFRYLGAPGSSS